MYLRNQMRTMFYGISYLQKKNRTFLEVQEDGMGEATTSGLNRLGAFGEKYFEVDHPFIFFLWDYHSGILLFIGRITAPEPFIN